MLNPIRERAGAGAAVEIFSGHRAFRDEVRAFLDSHLSERLRAGARATPTVFAEREIARDWHRILNAKGWLAYTWPAKFGGPGWSPIERYIFERECALADAPRLPVLGLKLLGPVLYTFGTAAQQQHYLPKILSGEHYWCQGFSEPAAGSDLAALKMRAVRDGKNYVVNGSKIWTTHAHFADHIFCLVRTDPGAKSQRGISFLLIDMKQPGVTVRPIIGIAGDHEINQVFFDDAVASQEDLVGEEGQGWSIAKFLLENERGGSSFAPKLLADIDRLRTEARSLPSNCGGSLISDPAFAAKLAKLELEAQALEITELRLIEELVAGRPLGPQTSLVKLVASNLRQHIDALAMSAFGYLGLQLETRRPLYGESSPAPIYGKTAQLVAPRYLNSRAWTIFGGTNEIQRSILAKSLLRVG